MGKAENIVQKDCQELLALNGIKHWRSQVLNGQARGYGEKRWRSFITGTKGLSDLTAIMNDGSGRTMYIETKAPGKKQSPGQKDFEANCNKNNVPYCCVDCWQDLAEFLDAYGILKIRMD